MGRKTLRVIGAAILAGGVSLATASPASAEPSAVIDDITLDGCDIVVTFTVGDAGQYDVEVWDDQVQIGDVPVTAEAGAQVQGRYTITAVVQQAASGLGIFVASPDGETEFAGVDPYNGADDIIDFCRAQDTTTTTVPEAPAEPPPAEPVVTTPRFTG